MECHARNVVYGLAVFGLVNEHDEMSANDNDSQ